MRRWTGMAGGEDVAAPEWSGQGVVVAVGALDTTVVHDPVPFGGLGGDGHRGLGEGGQGLVAGQPLDARPLPVAEGGADMLDEGAVVSGVDRAAGQVQSAAEG